MGTSPQLSLGPESTTALLTATTLAAMSDGDPDQLAAVAGTLAIATALVCVAARLLRAGYLSTLLSRPILVGYLLGIAVLMVVSQLGHLTGLPVPRGSVLTQLGYVFIHLSEINVVTMIMGAAMLVVLFVGSRLLPRLPWTLIADQQQCKSHRDRPQPVRAHSAVLAGDGRRDRAHHGFR